VERGVAFGEKERFIWLIRYGESIAMRRKKLSLFLDSGAYSAWSKGAPIDINEYIQFIKQYEEHIDHYSVLDDITDPQQTFANQQIMEDAGLKPVPCFHYNEPITYLIHYLEHYKFISLGGMVPIATPALRTWLDFIFSRYVCGEDGMPRVKIHGFGMTSHGLMIRYPWWSVDSTSWVMTGRHGAIYVPKSKDEKYDYTRRPHVVDVSNKSGSLQHIGKHLQNFSPYTQEYIVKYITDKKYKIGKSKIIKVEKGRKPGENERWFDRNLLKMEIILEEGVMNNYRLRDEMNILYYLDFEDSLPKWPWAFKTATPKRFGSK
jgi:hypothetical protein